MTKVKKSSIHRFVHYRDLALPAATATYIETSGQIVVPWMVALFEDVSEVGVVSTDGIQVAAAYGPGRPEQQQHSTAARTALAANLEDDLATSSLE